MLHVLSVAVGGAFGALARYWISAFVVNNAHYRLPYGTLICNVLGSFLMGVFFILIMEKARINPEFRPILMVGFLGAFTTFSSFSLEAVTLLQEGHIMSAAVYILLSVVLCLIALYGGLWFTRLF
ncbi:fluoride efflux transporter CrcB [Amphritea balenae]|uniref:Fluoride-specific ion channel FluC n=1 Tax=Amphritea balenae TaxID=452629 RepID=A0A3P1SLC0_9GAMM|nr:fluoride efflux transporter CrcB [Amphritea balenae]RRC97916.1 fluoride efflux transporter CrcB [Amphritea balenae]GGK81739.1 putative fluoride ion transporter CrcB [Amphritea balenae]